jgi:hypothetical protein
MTKRILVTMVAAAAILPAQSVQTMRASIRGGGGDSGKCTIEVVVDDVAEVEVRGDRGSIRTLQGRPSRWVRFECSSELPRNPIDFRFKGIDGRGDVQLVRDPSSGGAAVVRIQDRKGGDEGYTFDLEWRGSSGSWDNNRGRRDDPRYRDRDYGGRGRAVDAIASCRDAVRDRARRNYGVRDLSFINIDYDNPRGSRDRIVGRFEDRRGEVYGFSCVVNTSSGTVRDVDIRR